MAPVYFLKLDGIPGESRDPQHPDELELESFTWGESTVPRSEPVDVAFTAPSSAASPALFLACADGRRIPGAVLTIEDPEAQPESSRRWRFSDVSVSEYSTTGGQSGPIDSVTMQAESVEALAPPVPAALRLDIVRPDDLLNLELEMVNLRLEADPQEPALVVDDPALPAQLIVTFPPQTIAETAYFRSSPVPADTRDSPPPPPLPPPPPPQPPALGQRPFDPPGEVGASSVFPRDSVARSANSSRLVFDVPPGSRLPFTIEGLLDWSALELAVSPIAALPPDPADEQIASAPAIRPPEPSETALELPYRLVISPNRQATWQHRRATFTSRGRTELWHTRLALKTRAGPVEPSQAQPAPLRAIWSPDYDPYDPPKPESVDPHLGLTAMAPNDRHQLVILTSAFHGYESEVSLPGLSLSLRDRRVRAPFSFTFPYVPEPFGAEFLMLSPLGGWLRSRGHWTPPRQVVRGFTVRPDLASIFSGALRGPVRRLGGAIVERDRLGVPLWPFEREGEQLDLSEWVHIAAQGRDHYVRIVYEGELKPFGNRAALVKVTERRFVDEGGIVAAYHTQSMYIVVREPEKWFDKDDRRMPLKHVRLTDHVTPEIAFPDYVVPDSRSFWVKVTTKSGGSERFGFHGVGTDVKGNPADFTVPMMFVSIRATGTVLQAVLDNYNETKNAGQLAERDLRIPGQQLVLAEPAGDPQKRNTQLATDTLNFVVDRTSGEPQLLKADVRIPQVQELLGTDAATTIRLNDGYVANGFDPATGVFAEIAQPDFTKFDPKDPLAVMERTTLGVDFSADKAGGFATPNLGASTLTRDLGPLAGDPADAATGTFDPAKFFGTGLAMLFGSFDLSQLLHTSTLETNAPKLRTTTTPIPNGRLAETRIDWEPEVHDYPNGPVSFKKDQKGQTKLDVHGVITRTVKLDGTPEAPSFTFRGTLNAFEIGILGSVFVTFSTFAFTARSGQKPDVTVTLDPAEPLRFDGDLEFVDELRKAIPPDLFGDGPSLDVSPTGIRAGFAIGLPPIAVGVFSLKEVDLGAALTLPFLDGKPVLDFNVSRRDHPFVVAVAIFGGGGFFHLQLDAAGMKELEAALEFGATASLDIGVASGSVHMMAGIYFSLQRRDPGNELMATLTGYLRVGGSLSVLGLVTVSVEFNLSFTYQETGKAYGRATLTVQVEVAIFSKSVELTVERTFGGQGGDPKFVETFTTAETWSEYATAFA
jgi:type VI protein secretion system component Hcp